MKTKEIIKFFDSVAEKRDAWRRRSRYYRSELECLLAFLVPEGRSVLDIGSSTGDLLNKMKPSRGVGIDLSGRMVEIAARKYPHLEFLVHDAEDIRLEEKFDYVIISGTIGVFGDIWNVLRSLRAVMGPESLVVVTYYNGIWEPLLKLAERLGLKMPRKYQNWLGLRDIANLLYLNGYEVIKKGKRLLLPIGIPFLSWFINKIVAKLPLFWHLCLIEYAVARKLALTEKEMSCSVIVPCRNEVGNIEPLLERLPSMGSHTEIIFVDGYSTDGTVEKISEMIDRCKGKLDIKLIHQIPRDDKSAIQNNIRSEKKMLKMGKADALRKGFDAAKGSVLIILDADCTVPPEDIPKFYRALAESKGDFINGTRLVYPVEKASMRLLNLYANEAFGYIFSWLLGQPIKDTLCGTKAFTKEAYRKIRQERAYFGDFDPFGDFELLFGAAKQNLKITEIPVRYHARTYGDIKIERLRHGLLLFRMCLVGFRRFKLT